MNTNSKINWHEDIIVFGTLFQIEALSFQCLSAGSAVNDRYALQKSVGARNIKPILMGFPDNSVGKESSAMQETPDSIPRFGRSPGEGQGYPLQYSGLENFMDCIIHGVAKSRTGLSDFHILTSGLRDFSGRS